MKVLAIQECCVLVPRSPDESDLCPIHRVRPLLLGIELRALVRSAVSSKARKSGINPANVAMETATVTPRGAIQKGAKGDRDPCIVVFLDVQGTTVALRTTTAVLSLRGLKSAARCVSKLQTLSGS